MLTIIHESGAVDGGLRASLPPPGDGAHEHGPTAGSPHAKATVSRDGLSPAPSYMASTSWHPETHLRCSSSLASHGQACVHRADLDLAIAWSFLVTAGPMIPQRIAQTTIPEEFTGLKVSSPDAWPHTVTTTGRCNIWQRRYQDTCCPWAAVDNRREHEYATYDKHSDS